MSILQGKFSHAALFLSLNSDLVKVAAGSQCTFYVPSVLVLSPETIGILWLCCLGGALLSFGNKTVPHASARSWKTYNMFKTSTSSCTVLCLNQDKASTT